MLERITKYYNQSKRFAELMGGSFMAHPETLLPMPTIEDPVSRFVSVVKFYLSGWHIRPPYGYVPELLFI